MNGNDDVRATKIKEDLDPFLRDTYIAIEKAIAYTLNTFEKDKEDTEIFQYVSTVRYKTKIFLQQIGYDVKDLALNGLHVRYKGYEIKLLKDDHGLIPPARESRKRLDFYRQVYSAEIQGSLFDLLITTPEPVTKDRNLVVLYRVGRAGQLIDLTLSCTDTAKNGKKSPSVAWAIGVTHPAEGTAANAKYAAPTNDIQIFEDDDIDDDADLDIFKDGTSD